MPRHHDAARDHRGDARRGARTAASPRAVRRFSRGRKANASKSFAGPRRSGLRDARRDQPLPLGGHLQLAVGGANRAGPRRRPVHEHAVRQAPSRRAGASRHDRYVYASLTRAGPASSAAAGPARELAAVDRDRPTTTSRTAELTNASSAPQQRGQREQRPPGCGSRPPRASSSERAAGDARQHPGRDGGREEHVSSRHQMFAVVSSSTVSPSPRKSASSAPSPLGVGDGGHGRRVARRLHAREQARDGAGAERDQREPAGAQRVEPGGQRGDGREQRRAGVEEPERVLHRRPRRRRPPRRARRLPPAAAASSASAERSSRATCLSSSTGRPPRIRTVSNAARAAQQRFVVARRTPARPDRRARVRRRRLRAGSPPHASPPTEASSGRAFTHDSSISASGSESQTIPPPTQRWMRPSAIAKVRIVSARSKSPFG